LLPSASKGGAARRGRYRRGLRAAVGACSGPYGYTLTTWTTGAALLDSRGTPSTLELLAFVAGAVAGFALIGTLAFGSAGERLGAGEHRTALWGSFHLLSVGLGMGAATLVARLAPGRRRGRRRPSRPPP